MALNFPANPETGDQYAGPNGVTYTYDGVKWIGASVEFGSGFPIASETTAGAVKVDGTTITITDGVISSTGGGGQGPAGPQGPKGDKGDQGERAEEDRLVNGDKTVMLGSDGTLTLPPQSATLQTVEQIATAKIYRATNSTNATAIQEAKDTWFGNETLWEEVRDQDEQISGVTRPWSGMPSYEAYPVLMNYNHSGPGLPPASNLAPTANTAKNAYLLWKELVSNIDIVSGDKTFSFENTGNLTIPGAIKSLDDNSLNVISTGSNFKVASVSIDGSGGRVFVRADDGSTLKSWEFNDTGVLKLPNGGDIVDSAGNSVLGGGNANTGDFTFSEDTITNGDGLILNTNRGTLAIGTNMEVPGVAGHFHIAFDGSNSQANANDLFLGDDHNYVKLPGYELNPTAQYGVEIGTERRSGPQNIEVDDVDELVPPGGVWRFFIDHEDYPNLGYSVSVGDTVTTSWGTPITATITDVVEEVGVYWKIHVAQDITAGFSVGDTVSIGASGNSYVWRFGTDGTLTLPSGNTRIGNVFGTDGIVGSTGTGVGVGSQGTGGYSALQWIDDPEDATSVAAIVVNSPIASSSGTVQIVTGVVAGPTAENVWEFDANGVLTLPTNGTISYTPDDTDNWDNPTVNTVQAALDELAAKVAALENFEIDGGNAYTPAAGELLIDGNGA